MISNSDLQFLQPKNYLLSPGIETGRQGWSLFNTTLTSKIPTGAITAGAASITAFGASSTTPISGDYSLRVESSGVLTAGHGFISDAFTIDRQDKAKVMGWSFSFEAVSGTMNFSGTSNNTWAVYIYDVDGAAWIQPAGVYNLIQSSGVGIASGTFQTTATGTQYRIAVICITATGGAVEMRLDAFAVGPQKVLQGPSGPVGEIIATGSVTPPQGFLYCNGQSVSVSQYQDLFNSIGYTYGGAGASFNVPDLRGVFLRGAGSQTIGAETYTATLGTKQNDATAKNGLFDSGHVHTQQAPNLATGGAINVRQFVSGTGSVPTSENITTASGAANLSSTDTETRPANVAVAYHIRYLATYQMSQDTDTRVVALAVSKTTTQSITSAGGAQAVVSWASATNDTHASFNSTTGEYTVPVSGFYRVSGNINFASNSTSGRFVFIQLDSVKQYLSGIPAVPSPYDTRVPFAGDFYCNAGQKIRIAVDQTSGGALNIAANPDISETRLSISRISGPATIAASESVQAKFWASANHTTNSTTPFNYDQKVYDSHGAVTTGAAWKFTAPISGKYQINSFLNSSSVPASNVYIIIYKNGVALESIGYMPTSPGTATVAMTLEMNAGEYFDIRTNANFPAYGGAGNRAGSPCLITITRSGN